MTARYCPPDLHLWYQASMTKAVFVQPIPYEYPGTETLAACLAARGHEAGLVIDPTPDTDDPAFKGAALLCFSVMTGYEDWALSVAAKLKTATGALVVMGGPHPTHCPEIIEDPAVDVVCRGEGDIALPELADRLAKGLPYSDIPNLWVKDGDSLVKNPPGPPVSDLDLIPPPQRRIYYAKYTFLAESGLKPFQAGRGCPYDCVFCSNAALASLYGVARMKPRFKSPEALIREIEDVRATYGLTGIIFHDDAFTLDKRWMAEFLTLYRKRVKLPFGCQSRADALTPETALMLKEAGCRTVFFAIESGVEDIRRGVLGKNISDEEIIGAAKALKAAGVAISTYNMIGIPGETLDDAFRTVEMNRRIAADYPRVSFPTPYPGTKLLETARGLGLVREGKAGVTALSQQSEPIFAGRDGRAFKNLHSLFQTAVLIPGASPLVRILVHLPLGPLYRLWWAMVYAWVFLRSEGRSAREMFRMATFLFRRRPF